MMGFNIKKDVLNIFYKTLWIFYQELSTKCDLGNPAFESV